MIETIGYNEFTLRMLKKNIPEDYDLTKFPKDLLTEIYSRLNKKFMIIKNITENEYEYEKPRLSILRITKNNEYYTDDSNIFCNFFCLSLNKKQIATIKNRNIHIYNIQNIEPYLIFDKKINTTKELSGSFHSSHVKFLSYNRNDTQIIICSKNSINIYDSNTGSLIKSIPDMRRNNNYCCNRYNNTIAFTNKTLKTTVIKNLDTDETSTFQYLNIKQKLFYSPNGKYLVMYNSKIIHIIETETYDKIFEIKSDADYKIMSVTFSDVGDDIIVSEIKNINDLTTFCLNIWSYKKFINNFIYVNTININNCFDAQLNKIYYDSNNSQIICINYNNDMIIIDVTNQKIIYDMKIFSSDMIDICYIFNDELKKRIGQLIWKD